MGMAWGRVERHEPFDQVLSQREGWYARAGSLETGRKIKSGLMRKYKGLCFGHQVPFKAAFCTETTSIDSMMMDPSS
jgi:hypothetical protein